MTELLDQMLAAEKLGADGADGEPLAMMTASQALATKTPRAAVCLAEPSSQEWAENRLTCRRVLVPMPAGATEVLLLIADPAGRRRLARLELDRPGVQCLPSRHLAQEARVDLRADAATMSTQEDIVVHGDRLHTLLENDTLRRSGYLLGLAAGAFKHTVRRVQQRRQFGAVLSSNQAVAFPLAAVSARLAAARSLAMDLTRGRDQNISCHRVAGLWHHIAVLAREATALAVHLHGTHGLTTASPAQHFYRQVLLHTASRPTLPEG
ncbi:MAG TPA: acyl-CoA dehydrogenase family protein [Pseudonocardiaceae bacterium]|nr:acyl-CoA dehydrogenase family protein [Pseudonocardiaceae bacterium]